MDNKNLQPKQKAPVVRPTTVTPPQLSEEQLTAGITDGGQGLFASYGSLQRCSFDGDDAY